MSNHEKLLLEIIYLLLKLGRKIDNLHADFSSEDKKVLEASDKLEAETQKISSRVSP